MLLLLWPACLLNNQIGQEKQRYTDEDISHLQHLTKWFLNVPFEKIVALKMVAGYLLIGCCRYLCLHSNSKSMDLRSNAIDAK